ncbi:MAG: carbohydrate porin [Mariprofundaceae bacterium]
MLRRNVNVTCGIWLAALAGLPWCAYAIEVGDSGLNVEAGATIIGQHASKHVSAIDKDATASLDILADMPVGPGAVHLYIEGATSADISAASLVGGTNGDAGTAVNRNGRGRAQISELYYFLGDEETAFLQAGLIDPTRFADVSIIANDETRQFLADPLINNPAIAFPDYTLGLAVHHAPVHETHLMLVATGATGLGDDPEASYAELFDLGSTSEGLNDGAFVLAEVFFENRPVGTFWRLGGWYNSAELDRFNGLGTSQGVAGVYGNVDSEFAGINWAARAGWNNGGEALDTVGFTSIAAERAAFGGTFGLGLARQWLAGDFKQSLAPDTGGDVLMAEAYYRWDVTDWLFITPDIQYWRHPNGLSANAANVSGNNVAGYVWVYGLRAQISAIPPRKHKE